MILERLARSFRRDPRPVRRGGSRAAPARCAVPV